MKNIILDKIMHFNVNLFADTITLQSENFSIGMYKDDFIQWALLVNLIHEEVNRINFTDKEENIVIPPYIFKRGGEETILKITDKNIVANYKEFSVDIQRKIFEMMWKKSIEIIDTLTVPSFNINNYDAIFCCRQYDLILNLKEVKFRKVKIRDLLVEKNVGEMIYITPVSESRISKALLGEDEEARNSVQFNYINDDNVSRITNMLSSIKIKGYKPDEYGKYMVLCDDGVIIKDGAHRASCINYLYGGDKEIIVANWITKDNTMTDTIRIKLVKQNNGSAKERARKIEQKKRLVGQILESVFKNKRILFWGGGRHTEEILKILDLRTMGEIFYTDRNENIVIPTLKRLRIDELHSHNIDIIFISSFKYGKEMKEDVKKLKLGIPIYDLYENGIDGEFWN